MADPTQLLDEAVEVARKAGLPCEGWNMQSGSTGYAAWVYREQEDGQWSLLDEVEVRPTAESAATWCLAAMLELVGSP